MSSVHLPLVPSPSQMSFDDAIAEAFAGIGGGRTRYGWSSLAALQRCPQLYYLQYLDGEQEEEDAQATPSLALEVGILFHLLLAIYYENESSVEDALFRLEDFQKLYGGAECISTAKRLFLSYASRYNLDYLEPLAIEKAVESEDLGYSCRYDMIAQVEGAEDLQSGTYIVEHKTAARIDTVQMEGWLHDGEVVGQQLLYDYLALDEEYGPLRGTIMNFVSKESPVRFHRMFVFVSAERLESHGEEIRAWTKIRKMYETFNLWPKARQSCIGRYGRCGFYSACNTM